jgi:hypothetical protein
MSKHGWMSAILLSSALIFSATHVAADDTGSPQENSAPAKPPEAAKPAEEKAPPPSITVIGPPMPTAFSDEMSAARAARTWAASSM